MAKRADGKGAQRDPGSGAPSVDSREVNPAGIGTGLLRAAGVRYWTASVIPVLVGTTLPFWLRPPGFSFSWPGAVEVLFAAILLHAGFSFLLTRFEGGPDAGLPTSRLLGAATVCLVAAALIGLHLNTTIPGSTFLVLGLCALSTGALYVVPPLSFSHRPFGEVVISIGLGMLPVLAAYLAQTGDLTHRVYLASLPVVFATALWVWTNEMINRVADEKAGRRALVVILGSKLSGRFVVLKLAILVYVALFLAVFTASVIPLALVAVLTFGLARTVVSVSWNDHASPSKMDEARVNAYKLHLATGLIIAASALAAIHA